MSTIRIPNGFLTFSPDFKPGDPEPTGYLDWLAWAEVQRKAGEKAKPRAQAIKQIPMLFSAPMVRALLDGRKKQTRRLKFTGQVGDVIWVRETWAAARQYDDRPPCDIWVAAHIRYAATENILQEGLRARSAIHMPRWASRIELRVTAVRSERMGDISSDDAVAEGVSKDMASSLGLSVSESQEAFNAFDSVETFELLWKSIHGEWNPDLVVQVIEFERAK